MLNKLKQFSHPIIVLCIGLLAGFFFHVFLSRWPVISENFYKFSLTDLLQVIVTLIITIFGAYYLTEKLQSSLKVKEIFLSMLNDLHATVQSAYDYSAAYVDKPNADLTVKILGAFKKIRQTYWHICEIKKNHPNLTSYSIGNDFFYDEVRECIKEFDRSVTGEQFATTNPKYSIEQIVSIESVYSRLNQKIYDFKLKLFM